MRRIGGFPFRQSGCYPANGVTIRKRAGFEIPHLPASLIHGARYKPQTPNVRAGQRLTMRRVWEESPGPPAGARLRIGLPSGPQRSPRGAAFRPGLASLRIEVVLRLCNGEALNILRPRGLYLRIWSGILFAKARKPMPCMGFRQIILTS